MPYSQNNGGKTSTARQTMTTTTTSQLQADLRIYRGGNKARLIARAWVATRYGAECGLNDYDYFRGAWMRESFAKIHEAFDHLLPQPYRASWGQRAGADTRRQGKQANGLTPAQQKQFDRFLKAPARLERKFLETAEFFADALGRGDDERVNRLIDAHKEAAAYCRSLIGDSQTLAALWNLGARTGGDLESQIERAMKN